MVNPCVSIITVCYNAVGTIEQTLASVAEQEGVTLEHIVIDGNSNDGTQTLVKRQQRDGLTLVSEPDQGLYDAMNKGARLARGQYIAFLNADDVYAHSKVVADAVAALTEHAVDCVYANLVFVDQQHGASVKRVWSSRCYAPGLALSGWMPAHPTMFMRRSVFIDLGGFDLSLQYQADLEFCARAFEVSKMSSHFVPEVWVLMRLGGISTGAWLTRIKGNWESYLALRRLGLRRDPISFFLIKFGRKIPELFQFRSFAVYERQIAQATPKRVSSNGAEEGDQ